MPVLVERRLLGDCGPAERAADGHGPEGTRAPPELPFDHGAGRQATMRSRYFWCCRQVPMPLTMKSRSPGFTIPDQPRLARQRGRGVGLGDPPVERRLLAAELSHIGPPHLAAGGGCSCRCAAASSRGGRAGRPRRARRAVSDAGPRGTQFCGIRLAPAHPNQVRSLNLVRDLPVGRSERQGREPGSANPAKPGSEPRFEPGSRLPRRALRTSRPRTRFGKPRQTWFEEPRFEPGSLFEPGSRPSRRAQRTSRSRNQVRQTPPNLVRSRASNQVRDLHP